MMVSSSRAYISVLILSLAVALPLVHSSTSAEYEVEYASQHVSSSPSVEMVSPDDFGPVAKPFAAVELLDAALRATDDISDDIHARSSSSPSTWSKPLSRQEKEEDLRDFVHTTMNCTGIQSISVAFRYGENDTFSEGFGTRDGVHSTTPTTNYAIASTTKAFTAMAIVLLAQDGSISLDDPITKHVPEFKLYDDVATRQATFKDLLSHQTGMSDHGYDSAWSYDYAPSDHGTLAEGIGMLPPRKPFRSTWQYSNIMYFLAGWASSKIARKPWQRMISDGILSQLQMNATYFGPAAAAAATNEMAIPNFGGRQLNVSVNEAFDVVCPCGCLNSNAEDMLKWATHIAQIANDTTSQLAQSLFTPWKFMDGAKMQGWTSPTTGQYVTIDQYGYAAGWMIGNYRGNRWISHGGNAFGMTTEVTVMPLNSFSAVSMSNEHAANGLMTAINFHAYELFTGGKPWLTGEAYCKLHPYLKEQQTSSQSMTMPKFNCNAGSKSPLFEVSDYEGVYAHPYYGNITVHGSNNAKGLDIKYTGASGGQPNTITAEGCDVYTISAKSPVMSRELTYATFRFIFGWRGEGKVTHIEFQTFMEQMANLEPVHFIPLVKGYE